MHFIKTTQEYEEYKRNQQDRFRSYESTSERWSKGQRHFIDNWMIPYKEYKILDVACGDGVGLKHFKELGFTNVTGMEFEYTKALRAKEFFPVIVQDFHDSIQDNYDIIYSSHSLEHAFQPDVVLKNFHDHCKELIVVIPYPDKGPIEAHCAKQIMGSDKEDDAVTVISYIESFGFKLKRKHFDWFRESEIWMHFEKNLNDIQK